MAYFPYSSLTGSGDAKEPEREVIDLTSDVDDEQEARPRIDIGRRGSHEEARLRFRAWRNRTMVNGRTQMQNGIRTYYNREHALPRFQDAGIQRLSFYIETDPMGMARVRGHPLNRYERIEYTMNEAIAMRAVLDGMPFKLVTGTTPPETSSEGDSDSPKTRFPRRRRRAILPSDVILNDASDSEPGSSDSDKTVEYKASEGDHNPEGVYVGDRSEVVEIPEDIQLWQDEPPPPADVEEEEVGPSMSTEHPVSQAVGVSTQAETQDSGESTQPQVGSPVCNEHDHVSNDIPWRRLARASNAWGHRSGSSQSL